MSPIQTAEGGRFNASEALALCIQSLKDLLA
jgi:hypothetical protein